MAKCCVFIICAFFISIAVAAPAIDSDDKFKQKCKELGEVAQMRAFKMFSASRFREGDYLKIQCEVQPSKLLLEELAIYLGEQRMQTQSVGQNKITTTLYVTAGDRQKDLSCAATTEPTRPEEQTKPIIELTYTYINNKENVH